MDLAEGCQWKTDPVEIIYIPRKEKLTQVVY